MADAPPSTRQTHRPSLDGQLNAAILAFAPRYMTEQLERVALECDQRLERRLLPQLLALLREIDQERELFEEQKQDAARYLREQLNLLRFDAAAVDDAVGQLHTVAPRHLTRLPTAASLALPVSTLPSPSIPGTAASSYDAVATPDADAGGKSTPGTSSRYAQGSVSRDDSSTPVTNLDNDFNSQAQFQALKESVTTLCAAKRPKITANSEIDAPSKRPKTDNDKKTPGATQPQVERQVAFPNLVTGGRKGYFVVRCDYCNPGIFTEPPLVYNRALRHFQKHPEATLPQEELTNDIIFERYASRVDGAEMVSKYWIREHLGTTPHTFVPAGFSKRAAREDDTDSTVEGVHEMDDASSTLPKMRDKLCSRLSDREEEDRPHRARRNVPRPDYAEMVANKDPWNAPDSEPERTFKAVNRARSTSTKSRLDICLSRGQEGLHLGEIIENCSPLGQWKMIVAAI
ncbi:hypothetical protein F4802DRAFT_602663 [Xylaria palmicola]|nr:hypothetical protein F4802DRAFT_602663 [Xylaria palmicola]